MIIVKLHGGLGNQMFQYAFGKSIEQKTGQKVLFDLQGFNTPEGVTKRKLELCDTFGLTLAFASQKQSEAFQIEKRAPILALIEKIFSINVPRYVTERQFNVNANIFDNNNDFYLDGHWQSESFFSNITTAVREAFSLPTKEKPMGEAVQQMAEKIKEKNYPVSIQIRRADYVTIPKVARTMGTQPNEYYVQGIMHICSTLSIKPEQIDAFIFSDDIAWVKDNLKLPCPATYVSGPQIPTNHELPLMSLCKHHVISNSSFGWWGAWLNPRSNKTVIAPRAWFKDTTQNSNNITPPTWKRI